MVFKRLLGLVWVLALVACQKSAPLHAAHVTHANEPPDIAWFDGSVEGAFIVAKRENRPVLLYWGAEWCPFCHTLKSTVFTRPDFIAKSKLFLPLYMDGDDEGAQKWGEQFHVQGYPAMIVLDPDRHEIIRLGAGRDVAQYAAVLDLALEDLQPVGALLESAYSGRDLSPRECGRLAFNAWDSDTIEPSDYARLAEQLAAASQHCPADATVERANLAIVAAGYQARSESGAKGPPSARLTNLSDQVTSILAQPALAANCAASLQWLDSSFFDAVLQRGPKSADVLRAGYVAAMDVAASDARYVPADQLGFVDAKIRALKLLNGPKYKLPADLLASANARIDAALATEQNPYLRSGLVNASLNILEDVGDYPKAYRIADAEITRSATPYYFQSDLAEIAERLGHKDEAIELLDKAYNGSQGSATRFQWGELYVSGLLRMAPTDAVRIQNASLQVLGELDGSDRIYRRARVRLESLDMELRAWNDANKGAHRDVLQALHQRMQQICVKIPDNEPARASCDSFLNTPA